MAMKLFPAFLAIYFLLTRKFRALTAMCVTFAVMQVAALAVFGEKAFVEFVTLALPEIHEWRSTIGNVSISGFWSKLFDKGTHAPDLVELIHWPELARYGSAISVLVVLLIFSKARVRPDDGCLFGLTVTTILLITPSTWAHSQILLIPSIAILARAFPGPSVEAWTLRLCAMAIWMQDPVAFHVRISPLLSDDRAYRPIGSATYGSFGLYAMFGIFILGCLSLSKPVNASTVSAEVLSRARG
jgi:hypothetical protein